MDLGRAAAVFRFFVGGVGLDATELQLRTACAEIGVELKRVELVVNPATGCMRGFAFVDVDGALAGPAATANGILARMSGLTVNGRQSLVRLIPSWLAAPSIVRRGRAQS